MSLFWFGDFADGFDSPHRPGVDCLVHVPVAVRPDHGPARDHPITGIIPLTTPNADPVGGAKDVAVAVDDERSCRIDNRRRVGLHVAHGPELVGECAGASASGKR